MTKKPSFDRHDCYPENTIEYNAHNLFINAARQKWDAYTINAMIREEVALNPASADIYDAMREEFIDRSGIVVHRYYNPHVKCWQDSRHEKFDHSACCRENWISGYRYAADHSAPFFPNDAQREREEFEKKEKKAFFESQKVLHNGRSVNARHNQYHCVLLSNGWKYDASEVCGSEVNHKYTRENSTRVVVVTITQSGQRYSVNHPNGRTHSSYGNASELAKYIRKYSR